MKKLIFLFLLSIFATSIHAQETLKNSISTSLLRFERNSQTNKNQFNLKILTGIAYKRHFNRWSVGIKYEHGHNIIGDTLRRGECFDCYYGIGYMREDNIYITGDYTALQLFQSCLQLNVGFDLYYSHLNYSGDFSGGFFGGIWRENRTYNTFGFSPHIEIAYYPIKYLFIAVDASFRLGWGNFSDRENKEHSPANEFVLTSPELRIGVQF